MSQAAPKPHTVKVYGYVSGEQVGDVILRHLRTEHFTSRGGADRFASWIRKDERVSSAVVTPDE
jgi:hypothetical protein